MDPLTAALIGVGLAAGALAVHQVLARGRDARARDQVEARLREVLAPPDPPDGGPAERTIVKQPVTGAVPAVDRLVTASRRGAAFSQWLEQAGVRRSASSVLLGVIVAGAIGNLVARLFLPQLWVEVAGALAGASLPLLVLRQRRARRLRRFEEHFPEALDLIARAIKAGHGFSSGLKMVAEEATDPVGPEFRKTFDEQNYGLPLNEALANLSVRIPGLDVRFFVAAVLIQRETGGNLAEVLENLAYVVRERFKILRQVRVYTAHGRLTGYVLLGLPAALAVALAFINPDHISVLFNDPLGQQMLVGTVVMQVVGYLWIQRIIKIEV